MQRLRQLMRTHSLKPVSAMFKRCALLCLTLAMPGAYALTASTPPTVTSAQAFRCQDASGHWQYQQWPCTAEQTAQTINTRDDRTAQQRALAQHIAKRDEDLARHVSFVRTTQERQASESTAKARRLTVAPRQVAQSDSTTAQSLKIVPRKRDFRAASPKAVKLPKPAKPKRAASRAHTG